MSDERITLTDGSPVTPDHREIDPITGQQKGYIVLSAEERAKGFTRPVRCSYRHVYNDYKPRYPLRDLHDHEKELYSPHDYVKFEVYPENDLAVEGRFWTQAELDRKGCGSLTVIGPAIAETFACDPKFYSRTFCCTCREHFPVAEFVWEGTREIVGS